MDAPIDVLLVDDDRSVRTLTADALDAEMEAILIDDVSSPSEALGVLDGAEYDCVVSDYEMPGMNGIEFLKEVRDGHDDLPFILFTARGSEEIASDAISAGVTDYLKKRSGREQYTILANRITNAVEQYRARRAVEQSHDRLSLFFDQSPLGVIEWDDQFRFRQMNEIAEDIFGYDESELQDGSWEMIVPETDSPEVQEVVNNLLEAEGGYHNVNENVTKDGTRITCEWHNRVITDDDGSVVAILSLVRDVTDRERRKKDLQRYRSIVERAEDGIYVFDADAKIEFVNQRVIDLSGIPRDEWIGSDPSTFVEEGILEPEEVDCMTDAIRAIADGEQSEMRTELEPTVEGPIGHLELRLTPFYGHDTVIGFSRDITEKKEAEEGLRRRNEWLDEFVSMVSHDLRNQLTVAVGRLDLAADTCDSEHLDAVAWSHGQMQALIEKFETIARHGPDGLTEVEPVDLDAAARRTWDGIDTADATLDVGTDRTVLADEEALQRLLENLFRNAIEHGGQAVTVTVHTMDDGFAITDDGPGIPEAERDRVFEAGYAGDDGGTGYGLRIVSVVAEAHGWEVTIAKGDAGGARFAFRGVETASRGNGES